MMANDPHRDVLPVKEIADKRNDYPTVARYNRSELEDRFLRLYEENIDLKRCTNDQEVKIKKLGSKLLRFIKDKKSSCSMTMRKCVEESSSTEDYHLKILELQHENYSLKDKNTVLRQQLASHSRTHMAAHRSPVRLLRTNSSPRLTHRQPSVPNMTECSASVTNPQPSSELEMRDAEAELTVQNEEFKRLQSEIDTLKMQLDKAEMSIQKNKLGENIELIKLRRQNKQFDAQLHNLDHKNKLIQLDISRLQKENEDALIIITEKQNEVIDLQTKLNDALRFQQEWQELKEFVADITAERDRLSERCEALMTTISENVNDNLKEPNTFGLSSTKSFVHEERERQITPPIKTDTSPSNVKRDFSTQTSISPNSERESMEVDLDLLKAIEFNKDDQSTSSPVRVPYDLFQFLPKSLKDSTSELPTQNETSTLSKGFDSQRSNHPVNLTADDLNIAPVIGEELFQQNCAIAKERINLQREIQCLRDLLRSQTLRCEFQEQQINRLQQESQLNEVRYKDVYHQRDLFFRLLDQSDVRKSLIEIKPSTNTTKSSNEDSGGCPTGNTYTKKQHTYTMVSPIRDTDKIEENVLDIGSEKNKNEDVTNIPAEDSEIEEAVAVIEASEQPIAVPVAAPRKHTTCAVNTHQVVVDIEPTKKPDVQVTIMWLRLDEGSRLITDSSITALYVDFAVLSRASADYEIQQALAKPRSSNEKCLFNFTSDIFWENSMTQDFKALHESNKEGNIILFNVVSEPPPADSSDSIVECIVVGTSAISLQQFLFAAADEDLLLPIFGTTLDNLPIGTLAVKLFVAEWIVNLLP